MWQQIWNYIKRLWHEIDPIFKHTLVAIAIASLVSLSIFIFEKILPEKLAHKLHEIDEFLVIGCFWLLVGYTLSLLGIRLLGHLIQEIIIAFRKVREEVKGKTPPAAEQGQDGASGLGQRRIEEARERAARPEDVQTERVREERVER
jgi:hypothetical protein